MKSTFLKINLLLIVLIISFSAEAQKYRDPARIVTLNGDTVAGFFNYHDWKLDPTIVKFKPKGKSSIEQYGAKDIRAFLFYEEMFISRTVDVTQSPRRKYELSWQTEYPSATKTVFLRVIVDGEASLYQYIDDDYKDHYYLKTNEKPIVELIYFKYQREENNTWVVKENKTYIGQMIVYLEKCKTIREQINKAPYKEEALRQIVVSYNQCMNQSDFYVYYKPKTAFKIGAFAGVAISSLNFSYSTSYTYLNELDFDPTINPVIGMSFLYQPKYYEGNFNLYWDFFIKRQKYSGTAVETISENYKIYRGITIESTSVNFSAMGRYTIKGSKFLPYVSLGIVPTINFAVNSLMNVTSDNNGHETHYSDDLFTSFKVIDFDAAAMAGVSYKNKLYLNLRFDYALTTPYPAPGKNYTLFAIIGYNFN